MGYNGLLSLLDYLLLELRRCHTTSEKLPGAAIQEPEQAVQYGTDSLCAESGEQQRKT